MPSDVLNPSVVAVSWSYLDLYSEFDGHTWRTALAASADGAHVAEAGTRVVALGMGGRLHRGERLRAGFVAIKIFYWYEAGDPFRVALARFERWRSVEQRGERGARYRARAAVSMSAGSAIRT